MTECRLQWVGSLLTCCILHQASGSRDSPHSPHSLEKTMSDRRNTDTTYCPALLIDRKPDLTNIDACSDAALSRIIDDLSYDFRRINTAYVGQYHRPSLAVITELVNCARVRIDVLRAFKAIDYTTYLSLCTLIKDAHWCATSRRDTYKANKAHEAVRRELEQSRTVEKHRAAIAGFNAELA